MADNKQTSPVGNSFDTALSACKGELQIVECQGADAWAWVAKKMLDVPKFKVWCPVQCPIQDYKTIIPGIRKLCIEKIDPETIQWTERISQVARDTVGSIELSNGSWLTCVTYTGKRNEGYEPDLIVLHDISRFSSEERTYVQDAIAKVRKSALIGLKLPTV